MIVISRKIRRHHWRISRAAFVFLCVHIFYLTWINDIHPVYFALIPIVVVSAPIFFTRYSLLIPFLSLVVILTVLSGGMSGYSEKMLFYFLLIGLSLPVSFFNLFLFRRIIKKLQFSDYVLNNIDALVLTSNANGEVTFVSKNVNRILGYSRQEVLNRGWWNLRLRREATDAELASFQEHILAKADTEEGYDAKVLTKDGKEKWFHWKIVSLGKNTKVGVGQEITRKKHIENEYKKLSLIAQETDNLVILLDSNGVVEWVNLGYQRATNINPQELSGQAALNLFLSNSVSQKEFNTTIEAVKQNPIMHYAELKMRNAENTDFWVNISFTPILEEGEVSRIICIGRDSTKTKEAEEQIQLYSNRLKALHQLDQRLLQAESLDDIFFEISNNVKDFGVVCNRVSISIYEEEEQLVKVISRDPYNAESEVEIDSFPLQDFSRSIKILRSAEYVLNEIYKADEAELTSTQRYLYEQKGVGAYISLPIKYNNKLIGSLNFGSDSSVNFDTDTIEFLKEISSDVALAVYQFQLKEAINIKNAKLEQRNKDITDSINYAKRIQKAFLPTPNDLEEYFSDSFVFFNPKDNLSGDFYWVEETPEAIWVVVADCTGHGIPGALVSLVGTNILNQAIYEKKYQSPDEVLAYLNLKLIRTFSNHTGTAINDAMDIGICCIRKNEGCLLYAGVLNDLFLLRDKELLNFKSSRFPIGLKPERVFMDFEMHRIELIDGDQFYMLSDGYTDQFGGDANKKYGKRNLKKLLKEIGDYPMNEQCRVIQNSFELWKKDTEQTDDVVFIGFKVK
jgi:PAS domain S-box-containing protein